MVLVVVCYGLVVSLNRYVLHIMCYGHVISNYLLS
jgi:hypothetical protein